MKERLSLRGFLDTVPPSLMLTSSTWLFCVVAWGITYFNLGHWTLFIASIFFLRENYAFYFLPHKDKTLDPEEVGLVEAWIAPQFAAIVLLTIAYAVACVLPDDDREKLSIYVLCVGGVTLVLETLLLWALSVFKWTGTHHS